MNKIEFRSTQSEILNVRIIGISPLLIRNYAQQNLLYHEVYKEIFWCGTCAGFTGTNQEAVCEN